MQPVLDLSYSPKNRIYNTLIKIAFTMVLIQLQNILEQSMLVRYYQFDEENSVLLQREQIDHFEECI